LRDRLEVCSCGSRSTAVRVLSPPGSKLPHEIGNTTLKPRLYPQHRKSQVLWRVSIRYRPLIRPVQAWCYQYREGALDRGGGIVAVGHRARPHPAPRFWDTYLFLEPHILDHIKIKKLIKVCESSILSNFFYSSWIVMRRGMRGAYSRISQLGWLSICRTRGRGEGWRWDVS
jgi:hypothetical protein